MLESEASMEVQSDDPRQDTSGPSTGVDFLLSPSSSPSECKRHKSRIQFRTEDFSHSRWEHYTKINCCKSFKGTVHPKMSYLNYLITLELLYSSNCKKMYFTFFFVNQLIYFTKQFKSMAYSQLIGEWQQLITQLVLFLIQSIHMTIFFVILHILMHCSGLFEG